jgi:hypothetical protein
MGKCTNCGAALDPGWKFCIACGASVTAPNETTANETTADETTARETTADETTANETTANETTAREIDIPSTPIRESIPSAIRSDEPDDEPLPRKRMDAAIIFGIAMAVGGGVLIILVAMALFSPRG